MSISSVKTGAVGVSLLAGNAAYSPASYESISTVSLTANQTTISFTSIPSTYKHLQLRVSNYYSMNDDSFYVTFNGDSGANYSWHLTEGHNTSTRSLGYSSQNYISQWIAGASTSGTSSYPGVGIIDIFDYADTNKYKTTRTVGGYETNGTSPVGLVGIFSGNWRSTSAITSISIVGSGQFRADSKFALYGIKG